MRNLRSAILPPGGKLTIKIDPPVEANERTVVLAARGLDTAVLTDVDASTVEITNPTDKIAPVMFFVTYESLLHLKDRFSFLGF